MLNPAYGGQGVGFQVFVQSNGSQGVYADYVERDTYFDDNPTELARVSANEFLIIKLIDDGSGKVAYEQNVGGEWLDVTSLVQGEAGPTGATGNSFFFSSIAERDSFFDTGTNYTMLLDGLPVIVNLGNDTSSTNIWGGPDAPASYDNDLWKIATAMEIGGSSISSGIEVLNFNTADDHTTYLLGVIYDDTGSEEPFFWNLPSIVQYPLGDVFTDTLTDPQAFASTNPIDAYVQTYTLIPASSGTLRVQSWIGSDETGRKIIDKHLTVLPGDVGELTVFTVPNPTLLEVGIITYTKFSGVTLKGGLQTIGPFTGQTVPYMIGGLFLAEKLGFAYDTMTGFSLKDQDGSTPAFLNFTNSSDEVKGFLRYSESDDELMLYASGTTSSLKLNDVVSIDRDTTSSAININPVGTFGISHLFLNNLAGETGLDIGHSSGSNDSHVIGLIGNLIIAADDDDAYVLISPDGATGFKKQPSTGYVFDVYGSGSDTVGLYSDLGMVLETGTYGNSTSANFIFSKDGIGSNISEFAMYNDSNSTEDARHFRMGYADQIDTIGGLNIWKQRNNVSVGIYLEPDSVFTVAENTTETGIQAGLTILQEGTGDSLLQYKRGSHTWVSGVSTSGGNAYMLASSINLGSDTRFIINKTGEVKIPTSLMIGSESNPTSPFHVYQNDSLTGADAGATIEQDGADGDAVLQLLRTGAQRWNLAIDGSDDNNFKIGTGIDELDNAQFTITPDSRMIKLDVEHVEVKNSTNTPYGGFGIIENLLKYSEQIDNAVWQKLGSNAPIVVANDAVAPNGETTADKVTISGGAGYLKQNVSLVEDDIYTLSFWAKNISGDKTLQVALELTDYTSIEMTTEWKPYSVQLLANSEDYVVFRSVGSAYHLWGTQIHAGTENTPYVKTEENALTTASYGGVVDGAFRVDNKFMVANESNTHAARVLSGTDSAFFALADETLADRFFVDLSADGTSNVMQINGTLESSIASTSPSFSIEVEHVDAVINWKNDNEASTPVVSLISTGTYGSQTHLYSMTSTPIGYATAFNPGDIAFMADGVSSGLYQHVGASANNTDWRQFASVAPEVVPVWSLDDMPRVGGTGDVVPEYKHYVFMQGIDWGTTRLKLENNAYALFSSADVFVTSQTYSGTDPWIYGDGTIRCVGNGLTWSMTADNATMFDITAGGWGMDYSTLMTTGDNCSLGTITSPFVTDPLLGARFISTRSLIQGFKTGLTLIQPGNIHIDISFFYDADDAVGPMLSVIGMGKAGVIESTEVTMSSTNSSFLYVSPITEAPVTCINVTLADEQTFFETGDTGDITLFADASISAQDIDNVTSDSGTAVFEFTGSTVYVGQEVAISGYTTNTDYNGPSSITETDGNTYFKTGIAWGSDEGTGSFDSDSVIVTSNGHGLAELDAVKIFNTMEYNHGSTIYNVQTNTYQINTPWHSSETSGNWNDGSLDHESKYVNTFNCGEQQNSNPAPSYNVENNTETTSTTTSWGNVILGTTGNAVVTGNTNQNFVLLDDVTLLTRYEGIAPITIKLTPSISVLKSGQQDVVHEFRLLKTTGTPAFDPHTVSVGVGAEQPITLNCSAYLNPGDEFRPQVKAESGSSTITVSDFSL